MIWLQLVFVFVFLISVGTSIAGVVVAIRTRGLPYKPLWLLGSVFGFVGFSINWTRPDDLYLALGVSIPVFSIWTDASGAIFAKAMFPFVAAAAIWKADDLALGEPQPVDPQESDGTRPN